MGRVHSRKWLIRRLAKGLLFSITSYMGVFAGNGLTQEPNFPLYSAESVLWQSNVIPVCWENPSGNDGTERNWVQSAVADTWQSVSSANFIGWGICNNNSEGIRIIIADQWPQVLEIGRDINGLPGGMILNFTFQNWTGASDNSELCADGGNVPSGFNDPNKISSTTEREFCIKAIAIHEFGHALGFYHEQLRTDTPSWCTREVGTVRGGIFITPWDRTSIMNYCNPDWNGSGRLSANDIRGMQQVYGTRGNIASFSRLVQMRSGKCLTTPDLASDPSGSNNGAKTFLYDCYNASNTGYNQRWIVQQEGDFYRLIQVGSRKCLTTPDLASDPSGSNNGARVFLYDCYNASNTGYNQLWRLQEQEGFYRFVQKGSGKCLTTPDLASDRGGANNGARTFIYDCYNASNIGYNQRWQFRSQ